MRGLGRVVITAPSAMEHAFKGTTLTDSSGPTPLLFTGALVDGINTGEADRNQDGRTWDLGEAGAEAADNNHLGWVTWSFEIPAGVISSRRG